jgi:2'-5' RNA ligase
MKFFGNIHEELAPNIYAIIKRDINDKMFNKRVMKYELTGVGQFKRFTVLWIKMRGDIQFIQSVKNEIEDQLYSRLNIERDKRSQFKPHLTIGRLRKDRINYKNLNVLKNLFNENKETPFGSFSIGEVKLKRSTLTPKGPIYTDLVYE